MYQGQGGGIDGGAEKEYTMLQCPGYDPATQLSPLEYHYGRDLDSPRGTHQICLLR